MNSSNDSQLINKEANLWIRRISRGLSIAEKQQLIAWINSDEKHFQALHKNKSIGQDISDLNELNGLFNSQTDHQQHHALAQKWLTISVLFFSLFVMLMVINSHSINKYINGLFSTPSKVLFSTKIGEKSTYTLADGTVMYLNTNTLIELDFSKNHRKLTLFRGEAQFNVAKDKARPFTVISGEHSFTALGTIFNVQKTPGSEVELIVSEGKVLIDKADQKLSELQLSIGHESAKTRSDKVVSNLQRSLVVSANMISTENITSNYINQALAWQKGALIFDGETLSDVLYEVSRYSKIRFEITEPELNKIKVSGYFKHQDIMGLLTTLERNFEISYQINATNVVQISPKKKIN